MARGFHKAHRHVVSGRRRRAHALETLESRQLLACEVFLGEDRTLFVIGDDAANQIEILGTEQGIQVICDGRDHGTFIRLGGIDVHSGGGDDHCAIQGTLFIAKQQALRDRQPFGVRLGEGTDTLKLAGTPLADSISVGGLERENAGLLFQIEIPPVAVEAEIAVVSSEVITLDTSEGDDQVIVRNRESSRSDADWTILTGTGDDTIVIDSAVRPGEQSFMIDAGDGDNSASLKFGDGRTGAIPPAGGTIRAAYRSGQGDDRMSLNLPAVQIGDPNENPLPAIEFSLDVVPGTGDDEVLVAFEHGDVHQPYVLGALWNSDSSPSQGGENSGGGQLSLDVLADSRQVQVDLDILGGVGRDVVDVETSASSDSISYGIDMSGSMGPGKDVLRFNVEVDDGEVDDGDVRLPAVQHKLLLDGGDDADSIDVALQQVSAMDVAMFGGEGRDTMRFEVAGATGDPRLPAEQQKVRIDSGDGHDQVEVVVHERFDGELHAGLGDGNDHFRLEAPLGWQAGNSVQPFLPAVQVNGGAGSDKIAIDLGRVSGNLRVDVDGMEGNDHLAADLVFADQGLGLIDIALSGGEGNDWLSLLAFGNADPQRRMRLFLDGGLGLDVALATTNVEVANCEVVVRKRPRN